MLLAFKRIKIFSTCMFPSRHQNRLAVFSLQKKVLLLSKMFCFQSCSCFCEQNSHKTWQEVQHGKNKLNFSADPNQRVGYLLVIQMYVSGNGNKKMAAFRVHFSQKAKNTTTHSHSFLVLSNWANSLQTL